MFVCWCRVGMLRETLTKPETIETVSFIQDAKVVHALVVLGLCELFYNHSRLYFDFANKNFKTHALNSMKKTLTIIFLITYTAFHIL